jgi:Pyruvate/2-oxoacid:ferredoxin oxidoreductase delta subunit
LNRLQAFAHKQRVFVLITAGGADESGLSIRECEQLLRRKNTELIYSAVIQMPINWTVSPVPPYPPTKEEATGIISSGVEKATQAAYDMIAGVGKFHRFNYPKRYTKAKFYWEYVLFKYMGLQNLWRTFKVYDSCNGCQLCARMCPTHSINLIDQKPVWTSTCEQCMRCVNYCPQEAIYQSMGGETRGKNHYHEPGFRPERIHNINE